MTQSCSTANTATHRCLMDTEAKSWKIAPSSEDSIWYFNLLFDFNFKPVLVENLQGNNLKHIYHH